MTQMYGLACQWLNGNWVGKHDTSLALTSGHRAHPVVQEPCHYMWSLGGWTVIYRNTSTVAIQEIHCICVTSETPASLEVLSLTL